MPIHHFYESASLLTDTEIDQAGCFSETSLLSDSATARMNSSPQAWQKNPPSLCVLPPMAVSCTTAGWPHHSQTLPAGAKSTETGRRNSFSDMMKPPLY